MTFKANQYQSVCTICKQPVAPYAGYLAGKVAGNWDVRHAGACPAAPAPEADEPEHELSALELTALYATPKGA